MIRINIGLSESEKKKLEFATVETGKKQGELASAAIMYSLRDKDFIASQKEAKKKDKK